MAGIDETRGFGGRVRGSTQKTVGRTAGCMLHVAMDGMDRWVEWIGTKVCSCRMDEWWLSSVVGRTVKVEG